jgi:hypothetical protein
MSVKSHIAPLQHINAIINVAIDLLIRFIRPTIYYLSLLIAIFLSGCINGTNSLKFDKMLVEYAENPMNIDMAHPRFEEMLFLYINYYQNHMKY